jgi:hypothetical protein
MAEQIKYTAGIDTTPFLVGSQRIVAMMQGLKGEWASTAQSITGTTAGIVGTITTIAAAVGLVSFKKIVSDTIESAARLHDLSQISGMAVEELSKLAGVGKLSGTSLDTITSASNKLSLALTKTDEEGAGAAKAIKNLGLNFDDFIKLSPEERINTIAKAMAGFAESAEKPAYAMALFGKTGADLLPFMNDLAQVGELQAKVTAEQAAAADNFSDNLVKLQTSGAAWKKEMALAMIPTLDLGLQAILKVTNGTGGLRDEVKKLAADGSIAQWTRNVLTGLSYVVDGVQIVVRVFQTIGKAAADAAGMAVSYFSGVGEAIKLALAGNFSGAAAALRAGAREAVSIHQAYLADVSDVWSASTLGERFRAAMANMTPGELPTPKPRLAGDLTKPNEDKDEKPKREKEFTAMGAYEATLAEEKRLQTLLDGGREYRKEQEIEYWRQVLNTYEVGAKDRTAIVRKMADLEVAVMREKARQREQLDALGLKAQQDRAIAAVDLAQMDANAQLAAGDITKAQQLDSERRFEEQRLAIKLEYLRARMAMVDPERDPVAYAQASQAIEEAERQHRQRLRQIQIESAQNDRDTNPMLNVWKTMSEGMAQAASQILTRQQSLAAGLKSIWQGVRQSIGNEISKILAAKIMAYGRERLLTIAGIGMKAAEAGAGAAASQAGIPIVGPALALAAMGATMAAVLGLGASVPSAARGWDIPAGINPITQLHEQEMVLPADQANVIRDLAAGGGGGVAQPAAVLRTVGTMGDFLMVHRHDLAKVIKVLNKDSLRG